MDSIQDILKDKLKVIEVKGNYQETVQATLAYPPVKAFITKHSQEISQAMIDNSISKLHEFMRESLNYEAGKGMANPGFKPELFINGNYIDVRYVPTKEYIEATTKRQQQSLITNVTMSRDVREATLSTFDMSTPERKYLMSEIIKFTEAYLKHPHQAQGLYLYGEFGVGKTYLLGALANDLITKNISVNMLHVPTFAMEIKNSIRDQKTGEILSDIQTVDILIMDDIGAEMTTPWIRDEIITSLLEYRMKESLATFFTSNYSMNELEHHLAYSSNGQEILKAKRLMERIRYLAKEIPFEGDNLRQKTRQEGE